MSGAMVRVAINEEQQNRVRGVKGSKVLRTMKLKQDRVSIWKYFCDQTCMYQFICKHIEEFVRLHPRPEALETPIEVSKELELMIMVMVNVVTQPQK